MQGLVIRPLGLQVASLVFHVIELAKLVRNFLFQNSDLLIGFIDFLINDFYLDVTVAFLFLDFV